MRDHSGIAGGGTWTNGDGLDKAVGFSAAADGVAEGMEHLIVRLVAPTGGATLAGQTMASIYISDPGATAEVAFDVSTLNATERGFATAVAVLRRTGSAIGPVSVDYAVSGGDASPGVDFQGATSGTVSWADGDADPKWVEFPIIDDGAGESTETFELTLSNAAGATIGSLDDTLQVSIADGSGSVQAPFAIAGPNQTGRPGGHRHTRWQFVQRSGR